MRKIVELVLFFASTFGMLVLLVMIPIAVFAPARFTKPWSIVSLFSVFTFVCAMAWLTLGHGC